MNNSIKMPWLGLASYEETDSEIFHGRTKEIEDLFGDIHHNTQTVIYGPSGTGKTSIIRAGIFPLARNIGYLPIFIRLNHDTKDTYTTQIIDSIKRAIKDIDGEIEQKHPTVSDSTISLWEFFHGNIFWTKDNYSIIPLIVLDQFEEIFTLTNDKESIRNFFNELSDFCDNTMPQYMRDILNNREDRPHYSEKINYRLVLCLREDFLARLEEFSDKIPALRRNRYSLQPINEEQAMEIILKPSEGMVSREVAIEIIKKVTNNAIFKIDGIPEITVETALLSLFCNELNKKRIEDGLININSELVERFGDNIIKEFYAKTMSLVSEKTMLYLENSLLTKKGYRDSIALGDAFEYGVTANEIDLLQQNRLIHVDEWDGTKRIEFTHDVLCKVAKEKRDEREAELLFNTLTVEQRKQKRKNLVLVSTIIGIILLVFCSGLLYCYGWYWDYSEYYEQTVKKYGWPIGVGESLTKEGRDSTYVYFKLSRKGRWGNNGNFEKMEAYNAYGKPTTNHSVGTYLVRLSDENTKEVDPYLVEKLKSVYCWAFIPDKDGNLLQERAYDKDGNIIYIFSISQGSEQGKNDEVSSAIISGNTNNIDKGNENLAKQYNSAQHKLNTKFIQIMGSFTDKKGIPLIMRKNGATKVVIEYDQRGFEVKMNFFDSKGTPTKNYDGAYGQRYDYYNDGRIKSYGSVDAFGEYMNDICGNSGFRYEYDKQGRVTKGFAFDENEKPCNVFEQYGIIHYTYTGDGFIESFFKSNGSKSISKNENNAHIVQYIKDKKGNTVQIIYKGTNGNLLDGDTIFSKIIYDYDNNGYEKQRVLFNNKNELIILNKPNVYSKFEFKYDNNGNLLEEIRTRRTAKKEVTVFKNIKKLNLKGEIVLNYYYDIDDTICKEFYLRHKYDSDGELVYSGYFDKNNKIPIIYQNYHAFIEDTKKQSDSVKIITKKYVGLNNELIMNEKYARCKETYLNDNKIKMINYDTKGNIIDAYVYGYDKFGQKNSQSLLGICGTPIRKSPDTSPDGVSYYIVKFGTSYDFDYFFKGINEFNEPSYILTSTQLFVKKINGEIYDENNENITNKKFDSICYVTPQVIHCEIDSINNLAYKTGIRDGDILIKYGEWKFSFDNPNIKLLISELARLKENEKEIKIMRHFPAKKESKQITFILPKGLNGIRFTFIYYTQKEKNRLESILKTGYWKGK